MKNNNSYINLLNKRSFLMLCMQMIGLVALGSRLYYLQSVRQKMYEKMSNKNCLRIKLISPIRGIIKDVNGRILAQSKRTFRVHISKQDKQKMLEDLNKLGKIIPITKKQAESVFKRARYLRKDSILLVRENLNWEEMSRIYVNKPNLNSIEITTGGSRVYFYKNILAHTVGYVGKVSKKDVKLDSDPLLLLPGFEIGKIGVEKNYENILRGIPGTEQVEVNVHGQVINKLDSTAQQSGDELNLTIDARLQQYIMQQLKPYNSASMVVMDIHTGAIRAICSEPSFDPNLFVSGISHKDWNNIRNNPYKPLINKPLQGQYAPGSTFKTIVAIACLEYGLTVKEESFCKGYTEISGHRYHCWKKRGHGRVDLIKSLRESCDIWYYNASLKIGINNIAKTARKFGLGEIFDLGISSQKTGLIPDKSWKKNRYGKNWSIGDTVISSIGQGYVLATPLQLAVMTSRIANGGKAVEPHIASKNQNGENYSEKFEDININKEHIKIIQKGMFEVVNDYRGTARRNKPKNWTMAGKTGTSQVRRISQVERDREEGVRKNHELEWKYRDHALFIGYAPVEKPRYAISCVVEHGGSGSSVAVPLVKKVFDKIYDLEQQDKGKV